jgi:hypothetical protein
LLFERVEQIRPVLHEFGSLGEIGRPVIRAPHRILILMGQRRFDHIGIEAASFKIVLLNRLTRCANEIRKPAPSPRLQAFVLPRGMNSVLSKRSTELQRKAGQENTFGLAQVMSDYGAISRSARNAGCLFEAIDPRRRINRKGLAVEAVSCEPVSAEILGIYQGQIQGNLALSRSPRGQTSQICCNTSDFLICEESQITEGR